MRAVFFGTPPHAVPALAALCSIAEVELVVTQPDRPKGRSKAPVAPPVKDAASAWGIPVVQPERAREITDRLADLQPEVAVVAAFGQLIPKTMLEIPAAGFVNVHFSLLPRWRGASPVVRAILAGDEETGVTLMQMDERLDTGPILATLATPISPRETTGLLTARLAALGSGLLADQLPGVVTGELTPEAQDDAAATAAAMVRVDEAFVDPVHHSAVAIDRAVRAFDPWPGAWATLDGNRFKLWRVAPGGADASEPGVATVVGDRVLLGTRIGAVELLDVQPAGKGRMSAADWMRGRRNEPARFEVATPPPPR